MSLLAFAFTSCSPERESISVSHSDITESIYSSITLEPTFLYSVYSEIPGKIIKFKKETGDSISFGDILCTIDAIDAKNQSENAQLNLKLIQSKLFGEASVIADIEQEIKVAKNQYTVDSTQLTRMETLNAKKLASDVEFEQAQLKAQSSKVRLESLITQKKRSQRELRIQQQQAKNTYESALSTSSNTTITSIVDGVVYEIYKENGELVNSQQPIALIGSKSDFIIRMLVDEADITQVKIGQSVKVNLEAYSNETFTAKIDHIYPKMDPKTQSFQVIAKFVNAPPKLYLGLTGEANIIVKHINEAVVIPREYLFDENYVETVNGKRRVEVGLKSLSSVQVIDGLQADETIYLPQP
jgi:multidrug efflux pump subunit AcrA (membrane-fusion protein)